MFWYFIKFRDQLWSSYSIYYQNYATYNSK